MMAVEEAVEEAAILLHRRLRLARVLALLWLMPPRSARDRRIVGFRRKIAQVIIGNAVARFLMSNMRGGRE